MGGRMPGRDFDESHDGRYVRRMGPDVDLTLFPKSRLEEFLQLFAKEDGEETTPNPVRLRQEANDW